MVFEAMLALFLNIGVAGLLVTTIVFCAKLNRRILVLQDSKGDMAQLIRKFDEATEKASLSIQELQNASKKLNEDMGSKIQKANFIADDLAFMIEKGNKVAEKMLGSANASAAQNATGGVKSGAAQPAGRITARAGGASDKREGAEENKATINVSPAAGRSGGRASSALDSVMDRLGGRGASAPAAESASGPRVATSTMRSRSKTEQELLDALKNEV